jgi:serine/threonine protein kinase
MSFDGWGNRLTGCIIDGRYRIEQVVRSGGMGVITRAIHLRVGRTLALKLVPDDQPVLAAHLDTEARAAAKVDHSAVVQVYDVGHDPEHGCWYLAEQWLEGRDLQADLVEQGPWDAQTTRDLMVPVLEALAELHLQGVVHRDIKLENLMVVEDHGQKRVILVDFGAAKFMGLSDESETVIGSPVVMSPEQIRGNEYVGPQSDIWSMAMVLFTLLTGQFPFRCETLEQTLRNVSRAPIPILKNVLPYLSTELSQVIHKAMERSLADRYLSMEMFVADLRDCRIYAQESFFGKSSRLIVPDLCHTRRISQTDDSWA